MTTNPTISFRFGWMGWLGLYLTTLTIVVYQLPAAWSPYVFNCDSRQHIAWMYSWADPELFPNDYLKKYYFDTFATIGFKSLFRATAGWIDPQAMAEGFGFLLTYVAAGLAYCIGRQLAPANPMSGLCGLAVFLGSGLLGFEVNYIRWSQGGLQRGALMPAFFFRSPAGDFHCGLRGFSADAYRRMELRTSGMEFASEMVIKATLLDMKIAEVPTTLSPDGRSRPPHLRPWRDGWRHLRFMTLFSPRWLFLYPGIVLMSVGLLLGLWLMPGPRTVGSITLDIHTLLYSALAVLVGFQMLALALFTNIFATREGLIPRTQRLKNALKFVRMEVGLALGITLSLIGVIGTIYAVSQWGAHSFGPLDPGRTLRVVIPSFLALALGSEIVLASFFLGVLVNLPTRRDEPAIGVRP